MSATRLPTASYKYVQNPDGTVTINVYAVGRKKTVVFCCCRPLEVFVVLV